MEPTTACCVIVVAASDRLHQLAQSAIDKMGAKLRSGRAVKAEAKRFAQSMSAKPKPLHVEVFDVVGFCNPVKDRPDILEPIVIDDGRATPVTNTYIGVLGEYRVVLSAKLDDTRGEIIASCARTIANEVFLDVAMAEVVFAADPEFKLAGIRSNAGTLAVDLDGDDDGKIAKKLPKWITVESAKDWPRPD